METFLALIGFIASVFFLGFLGMKFIDAVFFFTGFRDSVTRSLTKIEERLNNLKP
jgi:hypothetical protein